jgi:hypothetical protein
MHWALWRPCAFLFALEALFIPASLLLHFTSHSVGISALFTFRFCLTSGAFCLLGLSAFLGDLFLGLSQACSTALLTVSTLSSFSFLLILYISTCDMMGIFHSALFLLYLFLLGTFYTPISGGPGGLLSWALLRCIFTFGGSLILCPTLGSAPRALMHLGPAFSWAWNLT